MRHLVAHPCSLAALVVGFLAAAPRPLLAQNLVTNPHFDTDLSGWNPVGIGTAFDGTKDANNSLSSGSVHAIQPIAIPNGANLNGVRQCVTGLTAGATYDFGGQILVNSAPAGGSASTELAFYSDNACTTPVGVTTAGASVFAGATFQPSNGSAVAPPGAVAAQIFQNERTAATPGTIDINEDEMFLQLSASQVPTVPRWTLGVLAGAVAAGGVLALRRRQRSGSLAG
ncbi:MAG TPA: hypothetical protein VL262_11920 [Vicinamibacterales bacterium]|jgi:hypothetical protein|nr:hypothetical protein [Vicinamibacterales bacterium]